ncbi:MAG TPA: serine/threonine-protein kinase, partial [Chthoniobacterales bacterium]|nr:serine/threonine-protein kinase [Chthoniobacterales bacterium]
MRCAQCNAELEANTLGGLCPVCLLDSAMPGNTEGAGDFHYDLIEEIARGGMGVVYRAAQHGSQRQVAVKMIAAEQAATPGVLERFRAEVEAVASLDHPHILPIYEAGENEGRPFYSMKFADRGSLREHLADYTGRPQDAARLMATVARAVHHAHQRGVLHRDLKPGNILLNGPESTPYVSDFGIAKWLGKGNRLTLAPTALGTPHYIAPEQAAGISAELTTAADVYSLGAILYELLTGQPPFTAESPLETLRLVAETPAPSPRNLDATVPRDLEVICLKCLGKEPEGRYSSAANLADDLDRWLEGRTILARPSPAAERIWRWAKRNRALAAVSVALVLALIGVAAGSTIAAARLRVSNNRALAAERDATEKLHGSYLAQARASRRTGRAGQRFDGLAALEKAARIRPTSELRNEAIAVLALSDLAVEKTWHARTSSNAPIAFDSALERYAVETDAGVIAIRRVADQAELARLPAPEGNPRATFITPFTADGKYLAVRHADARLRIWEIAATPRLVADLTNHPSAGATFPFFPFDCAFDEKNGRVAIGVNDGIALHELASGREISRFAMGDAPACLAFNPAGTRIAAVGRMKNDVQIFDLETGAVVVTLKHPKFVTPLAWSRDGRLLAAGCEDFGIYVWDAATGERRALLSGHRQPPTQMIFDESGARLFSTARDKTIRIWNLHTATQSVLLPTFGTEPILRLNADATRLACTSWDVDATILRVAHSEVWRQFRGSAAGERAGIFAALDFSPDEKFMVTSSKTAVRLFDLAAGFEVAELPFDGEAEKAALFQRDGAALLLSSRECALSRVPIRKGEKNVSLGEREVIAPEKTFLLNAISSDGRTLAVASRTKGETHLFSLDDPARRVVLPHQPEAWFAIFSPDGRWIVTCSSGHSASMNEDVKIWNAGSGELVHTVDTGGAGMAGFSADGRRLIVNGGKGAQLLEVGTWKAGPELSQDIRDAGVYPVFSPD